MSGGLIKKAIRKKISARRPDRKKEDAKVATKQKKRPSLSLVPGMGSALERAAREARQKRIRENRITRQKKKK